MRKCWKKCTLTFAAAVALIIFVGDLRGIILIKKKAKQSHNKNLTFKYLTFSTNFISKPLKAREAFSFGHEAFFLAVRIFLLSWSYFFCRESCGSPHYADGKDIKFPSLWSVCMKTLSKLDPLLYVSEISSVM